ncbi:MAG: 50S ribosomal protein L30e [Candidatus Micrarchaeia archaeon]
MARKKSSEQSSAALTFSHAVRQCVDSGKVEFGANTGVKRALSGKAKLVLLASNCPDEVKDDVVRFCKLSGVPTAVFEGTSVELGTVVGKPFPVSVLTVYDVGNSNIMEYAKQ